MENLVRNQTENWLRFDRYGHPENKVCHPDRYRRWGRHRRRGPCCWKPRRGWRQMRRILECRRRRSDARGARLQVRSVATG